VPSDRPATAGTQTRSAKKSPSAFRTIGEASEELGVPQHVLRFWETKFTQLKPLKRAGGRRYYRPEDMQLLGRIRDLLYKDGFTIKGARRHLRLGPESVGQGEEEPLPAEEAAVQVETAAEVPASETLAAPASEAETAEPGLPLVDAAVEKRAENDEAARLRTLLEQVHGELLVLRRTLK